MLQSLAGLQPFPLARTFKGYVKRDGKLKVYPTYCGKSNKDLKWMWRKRVAFSIIFLNIVPVVYLWIILGLLGNVTLSRFVLPSQNLILSLQQLFLIGTIFWSALGVFGFYRLYHALFVWKWKSLFCDIVKRIERNRPASFDAWAHFIWGMFYFLPPLHILIFLNCFM